MATIQNMVEDLIKEPRKTIQSLIPGKKQIKKLFSFEYDDRPLDKKYYSMHRHWVKWLHDYYFKVEHVGHVKDMVKTAAKEKVMLISNHANTLEVMVVCYQFLVKQLGLVNALVFKEAFRLPFVRELFRSGQCIPVSVQAGKEALKKNHIMLFPEGMEFIKHYLKKDYVVRFHKGFLRIAREYLRETKKSHVFIQPVGHEGIDYTIKFWVLNQKFLVEKFIKPILRYPYFVLPKAPIVFPTRAVFNWGTPRKVTLKELKDEKSMGRLAEEFRHDILRLRARARKLRTMSRVKESAA